MTTLRPQSSIGKYQVLPSISPTHDLLSPDAVPTSRSDGSEDQRGVEEAEHLALRMAQHTLDEASRIPPRDSLRPGMEDRPLSRGHSAGGQIPRSSHTSEAKRNSVSTGHVRSGSSSSSVTSPEPGSERCHTSISQYRMDEAPKPSSEGQVLLGIKIPTDGTRHKHYFNSRDQLRCIVLFAEEVSGEDFSNHILVLATPRQRFDNLSQTIEAAGLQSKSVLHLEESD